MASVGEELTLSERLTPGTVGWAVEDGMSALEVYGPPSLALAACVYLSSVFEESVVVPSPWLVRTPGVGEGYSCPKARVEVRVDREPAAGAWGTGVSAELGLPGAGRGRRSVIREGKFRGTRGERCVG